MAAIESQGREGETYGGTGARGGGLPLVLEPVRFGSGLFGSWLSLLGQVGSGSYIFTAALCFPAPPLHRAAY